MYENKSRMVSENGDVLPAMHEVVNVYTGTVVLSWYESGAGSTRRAKHIRVLNEQGAREAINLLYLGCADNDVRAMVH